MWLLIMDDVKCFVTSMLTAEIPHESITGWHSQIERHSTPHAKLSGHLDHSRWAIELRNIVLASKLLPDNSHFPPGASTGCLGLELLNIWAASKPVGRIWTLIA